MRCEYWFKVKCEIKVKKNIMKKKCGCLDPWGYGMCIMKIKFGY